MRGSCPRTWCARGDSVAIVNRLLVALALVGCGKGGDKAAPPVGSGSGSGSAAVADVKPFEHLTVTSGGKPVAMQRAFIKRVSPDQWRLLVGTKEGSCEELLSGITTQKEGGTSFVVGLRRRIAADGSDTIAVTDLYADGQPAEVKQGTAQLSN